MLKAIAPLFEISSSRIGQIKRKALWRLRHPARHLKRFWTWEAQARHLYGEHEEKQEVLEWLAKKEGCVVEELTKRSYAFRDLAREGEKEQKEEREAQDLVFRFRKALLTSIDELCLSVRSANCLKRSNTRYIYELVQKVEVEMLSVKNFGLKSLNEIKELLAGMGLSLGMKLPPDWNRPQSPL